MDISDIRRKNINKGRLKSNQTNKLKGLITFVKNKTRKQDIYHNELIDYLIENKSIYDDIYNRWLKYTEDNDDEEDKDDMNIVNRYISDKELEILATVDFVNYEGLNRKIKGYYIREIDLNDNEKDDENDDDNESGKW